MPEAKLGRCIRSKEKELLDKCDGLATAAGSESEHDRVTIYSIYTQRRVGPDQFGWELSSADRRSSASRCCVMQESSQ